MTHDAQHCAAGDLRPIVKFTNLGVNCTVGANGTILEFDINNR